MMFTELPIQYEPREHALRVHIPVYSLAKGKLFKECETCPVLYDDLNPQSQKKTEDDRFEIDFCAGRVWFSHGGVQRRPVRLFCRTNKLFRVRSLNGKIVARIT